MKHKTVVDVQQTGAGLEKKKNKSVFKCPKFSAQLLSSGGYFLQLTKVKALFTQRFSNNISVFDSSHIFITLLLT